MDDTYQDNYAEHKLFSCSYIVETASFLLLFDPFWWSKLLVYCYAGIDLKK